MNPHHLTWSFLHELTILSIIYCTARIELNCNCCLYIYIYTYISMILFRKSMISPFVAKHVPYLYSHGPVNHRLATPRYR